MNLNNIQEKEKLKLLIFKIDNQQFALPITAVEKVIEIVDIRLLPKTPKYVCGIINMHGEIISVINLRLLFGLQEKEIELSDQLLIVSTSLFKHALWIDSTDKIIEIDRNKIVHSEEIKYGEKYVQGVVKLENGMVLINDVEKFLSSDELKELELALKKVA
jgi:purine-binding chemotaxis protein CheW